MSGAVSLSAADPYVDRAASILDRLFPPPRSFTVRLWEGTELPAADPAFSLTLNHAGALRQMLTPPIELSLGEAFIYGDFDLDGDIISALSLLEAMFTPAFSPGEIVRLARDVLSLPRVGQARLSGRGPAHMRGAVHSRDRDRSAIEYHYNVGNDFYALWLDRWMQYSCGYFPTGTEDIHTAQERKLEHICRKLRLNPGERLLDIGCGWGGLAMYAAGRYRVHALGVTLSDNQTGYASDRISQSGLGNRVSVRLQDYRDLDAESFDKIVSVGMFEHVGRSHLPEYFAQVHRLLRPGGLFLNHGISYWPGVTYPAEARKPFWQKLIERRIFGPGTFSQQYIFPDGELVPVSEVNLIAERSGFEVRDLENLRQHYALTLRHWFNRLEDRRAQAIDLAGEVTYRTWRLFLASSAYGFEAGNINVNQTLLSKTVRGRSSVPLTRADVYE